MSFTIHTITADNPGPLSNNVPNQIGRAIGRFVPIFTHETCGTVKGADGQYYDWWTTEEKTPDGWPVVRVIRSE